MFICWGKRIIRRKKGYVADYCSVCRSPQAMHATELREVNHVYWIRVSSGQSVAFESKCLLCKSIFARSPHSYTHFVKEPSLEQAHQSHTTPGLGEYVEERMELEERLHAGFAGYSDRMALIHEIIHDLEYMAEKKASSGWSEHFSMVLVILFLAGLVGSALCGSGHMNCPFTYGWYLATAILMVVVFYRVAVLPKRLRSRGVMSLLARGLVPIDPSREELESVIGQARGSKLASSIRVDELIRQIESEVDRVDEHSSTRSS